MEAYMDFDFYKNNVYLRQTGHSNLSRKSSKLESGINSWMKNFSRDEKLKRHLPGRYAVTITIRNSNDVTQLYTWDGKKFAKSHEKNQSLFLRGRLFVKNEKESGTLEPTIIYSRDILQRKISYSYDEKWKKTNNGRNRTAKSRNNWSDWRKGK